MKKIFILIPLIAGVSCTRNVIEKTIEKQVDNTIEKEILVDRKVTSEEILNYYFEEADPITLNKAENESFINIQQHNGALFLLTEITNANQKSYAVQRFDLQTKTLSKVIENLTQVESMAFSEKYVFISQGNSVKVYNSTTYQPELTIGLGASATFRLGAVRALFANDKYLFVRDNGQLYTFKLENITAENHQKVPVFAKTARYTADSGFMVVFNNKVYFNRTQNGEKRFQHYDLNEQGSVNEGQLAASNYSNTNPMAQFTSFAIYEKDLYVSYANGSFGIINPENNYIAEKTYTLSANVDSFTMLNDKVYAINKTDNKLLVMERKNLIFRKYED